MEHPLSQEQAILAKVTLPNSYASAFVDWQGKWNNAISKFPGFISLEVTAETKDQMTIWTVVERFSDDSSVKTWSDSNVRKDLLKELQDKCHVESLDVKQMSASELTGGVTEVFVTRVSPDKVAAFRTWIAKMHQTEAKFPGFQGMYLQAPNDGTNENWLTFLRYDSTKNLDIWLSSQERQNVLEELKSIVFSLESHRVVSPYSGWFSSISGGVAPISVVKQTMIILLMLFPVVMLELKFLSPFTKNLNPSLGMFIGNVISVSLLSWPLVPTAIKFLQWWLVPKGNNAQRDNMLGYVLMLALYLLEILIFWS